MKRVLLAVGMLVLVSGCVSGGLGARSSQSAQQDTVVAAPSRDSSAAAGSTPASKSAPGLSSVARGEIVFQSADGSIHAIHSDGTSERRVADPPPRRASGDGPAKILAWLPGRRIVACVADNTLRPDDPALDLEDADEANYPVYLVELETGQVTPLNTASGLRGMHANLEATFSHDGKKLLYFSAWDYLEYAADINTGIVKRVSPSEAAYSDDGTYARMIWPHGPKRLEGRILAASPDERFLFTETDWESDLDDGLIYGVFDRRTGRTAKILVTSMDTERFLSRPSFSLDAKLVVFEEPPDPFPEVFGHNMDYPIMVVSRKGGKAKRIATGTAPVFWPGP